MLNNVLVRIKPFLSFELLHCWSILAFLCRHPRGSCLWQNESLQQQYSDNGAVSTPVSLSLRAQWPLFSFSRSRNVYSPWVQRFLQPLLYMCIFKTLHESCKPSGSILSNKKISDITQPSSYPVLKTLLWKLWQLCIWLQWCHVLYVNGN